MTTSVKPSQDFGFAAAILRIPEVYDLVADDSSPPAGSLTAECLASIPGLLWMEAFHGESKIGGFVFAPVANGYDAHTLMLPGTSGVAAVSAGRKVIDWVFEHTDADIICGRCPDTNPAILRYALALGMIQVKRSNDWMKRGIQHSSAYAAIDRAMWNKRKAGKVWQ